MTTAPRHRRPAPAAVGRPRLAPGEHGEPWVQPLAGGKFVARVRIRGRDGRARELSARGTTRGAALRELHRRLDARRATTSASSTTSMGVVATMTVADLSAYWLEHRARHGLQRRRGPIKPSTLAAYSDATTRIVNPNLGGVRLNELTVGLLEAVLGDVEHLGLSTDQARSALNQMLALAVRHGAIPANPMSLVATPLRDKHEVHALTVDQARALRALVRPEARPRQGGRRPNRDLTDVIDTALGTGCRIGELLAITWNKLDLTAAAPTVLIDGTLIEPKKNYVPALHRQDSTKNGEDRTLILPDAVVDLLLERRAVSGFTAPGDPVFASSVGTWLWPNNIRTRMRSRTVESDSLRGTTPHTLRRTVGTLIAHEASLDAAREQLGHTDSSITARLYVAKRPVAADVRHLLDRFFD